MDLRDYQKQLIVETRANLKKKLKVLIVSPTASGKTATLSYMIKTAQQREFSTYFVVHKRDLLRQIIKAFKASGIDFGVIAAKYPQEDKMVQICMAQTLAARKITPPDTVVLDEAHRSTSTTYDGIFAWDCYIIGLTATPERTDGRGLGDRYDVIVEAPSVQALIDMGYLSPYKYYAPNVLSLKGVRKKGGNYKPADLDKVFEKATIVGDSIKDYKEKCYGKKMLVFCYSVKHAEDVAAAFNDACIPAAHLDGGMNDKIRQDIIDRYVDGNYLVLTSCDLLLEGIDVPTVEVIDQQRPTDSLIVFMQSIGRGFRIYPGKEFFTIFDRVGNYRRHGLPNMPRHWSLESKAKSKRPGAKIIQARRCPDCLAVSPGVSDHCIDCGVVFIIKQRNVRAVGGELVELTTYEKSNLRMEVGGVKSKADLIKIATARGYKPSWIRIQMKIKKIKS